MTPIVGLHHVTAIASDPQQNLDFYTQVLGLRLVKKTVNFDDPGTYHFYFGDDAGTPGTILTFFPWPGARRGLAGAGEVTHTAFSVPLTSIPYWEQRLQEAGVLVEHTGLRFASSGPGEDVLTLADPDGMKIEIVGQAKVAAATAAPRTSDVPEEHSIRGFFGVTMLHRDAAATAETLGWMGFAKIAEEGSRMRFSALDSAALGNHIDIVVDADAGYGRSGAGSVHHIAFRTPDDASQLQWRSEIAKHLPVTTVQDRDYFHSIYFREPGGVLFELATDTPGFATDEPLETLGEKLRIPAWLEPQHSRIEARLQPVELKLTKGGDGMNAEHPHGGGALLHAGAPLDSASGAVILLHGRGGSAEDILGLASSLDLRGMAYLAPQAEGSRWYPDTFMAELRRNEPWLSSALRRVQVVVSMAEEAGIPTERIAIGGFSQGACLSAEFAARNPRRYAALLILTGGLMGPAGSDLRHDGDLAGTPALVVNGDRDQWIPWERTLETAAELRRMGAAVELQQYPGRPHTVTSDEIGRARTMLVSRPSVGVLHPAT